MNMTFKLPEADKQLALQLWEMRDQSAFELGRLVSMWVKDQAEHDVTAKEVYAEFSQACKGASARTLRYYAETVAFYELADWEEFYALSFDHFAKAAYLERNNYVPKAKFALQWATTHGEGKGKGSLATVDRMMAEFLPQDEIEFRAAKRRTYAFNTLRAQIESLPKDTRKMAERLLLELEKIMNAQNGKKLFPDEQKAADDAMLDQIIEKVLEEAGAQRVSQANGVTVYSINKQPEFPQGIKVPGFATLTGIRTKEAAAGWGLKYKHPTVMWLKNRDRVYAVRSVT
jgi:hypothetical protein